MNAPQIPPSSPQGSADPFGTADPYDDTQPTRVAPPAPSLAPLPPLPIRLTPRPRRQKLPRKRERLPTGCSAFLVAGFVLLLIYLLLPFPTTILLLGTDSREADNPLGRTDTMVMTSINPLRPEIGMLSLPRDLWVNIPGYGENRVNAAFFFYEADEPGSGPWGAIATLDDNFGVGMDYYVLFEFNGIVELVDALGGVEIDLPRAMSGYAAGSHRLDGTEALAFVRDRSGSDDFFRIERGQIFIRAFIDELLSPRSWPHLPAAALALADVVETNLPVWLWPRLTVALLRAGPDGIEGATITHEMVTPFTTEGGASVLLPNWDAITPVVEEIFGG